MCLLAVIDASIVRNWAFAIVIAVGYETKI